MGAAGEPSADQALDLNGETARLRRHLIMLARDYEADPVHTRYPLIARLRPGAGHVRRLRAMIGRLLRSLGFRRAREQWLATLNHQQDDPDAQPLLIWGLGVDRETLRLACAGFRSLR